MDQIIKVDEKLISMEDTPSVSLIIRFEPAMANPRGLSMILSAAAEKAEKDLMKKYSREQVTQLINGLREIIQEIQCSPNEKTLAILVSQFAKRVYYFTPSKNNHMPPYGIRDSELEKKL
ncbi:MAG: hypothetical protein ABI091_06240 [Ferruginibacter sp.]